jgi:hypothetical protein
VQGARAAEGACFVDADGDAGVVALFLPGFSRRFADRMGFEAVGEVGGRGDGERSREAESCADCEA